MQRNTQIILLKRHGQHVQQRFTTAKQHVGVKLLCLQHICNATKLQPTLKITMYQITCQVSATTCLLSVQVTWQVYDMFRKHGLARWAVQQLTNLQIKAASCMSTSYKFFGACLTALFDNQVAQAQHKRPEQKTPGLVGIRCCLHLLIVLCHACCCRSSLPGRPPDTGCPGCSDS